MYPPFSSQNSAPHQASGLRTVARKVKIHSELYKTRLSLRPLVFVFMCFVLGAVSLRVEVEGLCDVQEQVVAGACGERPEADERPASLPGGVSETALHFSCYFFWGKPKEVRKECVI